MRPAHDHGGETDEALKQALHRGDPQQVRALLDGGADIRQFDKHGYDAVLHAVHGCDVFGDTRLIALLSLLVERGAGLDTVTRYAESGLRVLSRLGRFDAVQLLLDAGADERQLAWSPLIRATGLGSADDMRRLLAAGAPLEDRVAHGCWPCRSATSPRPVCCANTAPTRAPSGTVPSRRCSMPSPAIAGNAALVARTRLRCRAD